VPEDVPNRPIRRANLAVRQDSNPGQRFGLYTGLASHPYAAFWKLWISRIQLVSGFHLGQIWATISKLLILMA
jgi:hypothetical protein